jgi:hypothetical protein
MGRLVQLTLRVGTATVKNDDLEASEDHDREIRRWMTAEGWEVTRTKYSLDPDRYAWWHDVPGGGPSPTLRLARYVLEKYPAFLVVQHLETLKVAQGLRGQPDAMLIVTQSGSRITLKELRPK